MFKTASFVAWEAEMQFIQNPAKGPASCRFDFCFLVEELK